LFRPGRKYEVVPWLYFTDGIIDTVTTTLRGTAVASRGQGLVEETVKLDEGVVQDVGGHVSFDERVLRLCG
jgi:hypothetical protein